MHLSYVKQEGGNNENCMDGGSTGTFCLGLGMAEVGARAVRVAKNRGDTQPPGDMSADQTLHAATRPRQFSGGLHGCSWASWGFCWDR